MSIKEKIKATILVSKLASQFNKNPEIKEQIKNFENNIQPKLCDKCQKKFPIFRYKLKHTVAEGRVFCKPCNTLIAKEWAELFAHATKETKK